MAKESYCLKNVAITYAPMGTASFDCKNGLAEGGAVIAFAEDFGERTTGSDGSSLWSEYMTSHGTVTLNLMANSPGYAFFVMLHNAQRATGKFGADTMTIVNKDFTEMFSCGKCAVQSISGETYDKAGNTVRVVTINCGEITRMAA